jgi:uncharacterized lipoprotein YehR (DUF1307 family)
VCGCGKEEEKKSISDVTGTTTIKQNIVDESFNENGTGTLKCSTEAVADEGIDVDLNYTIKYKNGNILELVSIQKVSSENDGNLDLYENAYKNIAEKYYGLEYYDNDIVRDSNSVSYTITINYDKIDIKKLLAIEGEEDNIIKNGKAKLSLWLDLAGKMGTVCEEA